MVLSLTHMIQIQYMKKLVRIHRVKRTFAILCTARTNPEFIPLCDFIKAALLCLRTKGLSVRLKHS